MGAKTGYADCILALAGLEPGDKAAHYLWCEPDDGVRLLLHAYRDADFAREAARIIRSWADEEPRALWERLRAEGPARCPPVDAREVARWQVVLGSMWVHKQDGRPLTGWAWCDDKPKPLEHADRLYALGGLPATIHDDATTLDPREVARWVQRSVWSYEQGNVRTGFVGPGERRQDTTATATATAIERDPRGLPATIHDDATTAPIPDPLPEGTLVFIDPPYVGTTGYAHDLDRPAVVRLAQRWAAAGARVMISEAVPIDALVACGWHAVEVSAMRVGQKRTFSKQQREWLTTSFEPDRRAVRACELAAERAERAAAVMAGGEQRDLFDVPKLGDRSRGGGWQSATGLPTPSTGADGAG